MKNIWQVDLEEALERLAEAEAELSRLRDVAPYVKCRCGRSIHLPALAEPEEQVDPHHGHVRAGDAQYWLARCLDLEAENALLRERLEDVRFALADQHFGAYASLYRGVYNAVNGK